MLHSWRKVRRGDSYVLNCIGLAQDLARFDISSGSTNYCRTLIGIIDIK
jgi:hypothetical protein